MNGKNLSIYLYQTDLMKLDYIRSQLQNNIYDDLSPILIKDMNDSRLIRYAINSLYHQIKLKT